MQRDDIRDSTAKKLIETNSKEKAPHDDLMDILKNSDKDLFIKYRDEGITLTQLQARVAERKFNVKYTTLDDLKPRLVKEIYEDLDSFKKVFKMIFHSLDPPVKDLMRELKPHEINDRCLKSISYKHKKPRQGEKK